MTSKKPRRKYGKLACLGVGAALIASTLQGCAFTSPTTGNSLAPVALAGAGVVAPLAVSGVLPALVRPMRHCAHFHFESGRKDG